MKETEIIGKLSSEGKCVFVGEWRGFMPETINYTNKKGQAAKFARIVHTVEVIDGQRVDAIKVSQSVPDGTDPAQIAVPYKRGQRVVVEVDTMEVERGNRSARSNAIHATT
jgi:hypothetical protein